MCIRELELLPSVERNMQGVQESTVDTSTRVCRRHTISGAAQYLLAMSEIKHKNSTISKMEIQMFVSLLASRLFALVRYEFI
jgi:hypothetical protein